MRAFEKFSELSVHETQVLAEALRFWIASDKILEPSILRNLLPGIDDDDKMEAEEKIKAETERLTALRTEDTSQLVFTLEELIAGYAQSEIKTLIGES